jgi:hypothetical protein
MFSARKQLIRLIGSAALLGAIGHLLLAFFLLRNGTATHTVHPSILLATLVLFGPLAATSALDEELSRAIKGLSSFDYDWWQRTKMRLYWCPPYLLFLYPVALAIGGYSLFLTNFDMSWSSDRPLTHDIAASFSLWISMFLFGMVPELSSAARMPGTYAIQFGSSPTGANDVSPESPAK